MHNTMKTKNLNTAEEQRLREEGFQDCRRYIESFDYLKNMKNIMDTIYPNMTNKKLDILEETFELDMSDVVLESAMGCLESCTEIINRTEEKYKGYLGKIWQRHFQMPTYRTLLKDFAEVHKKLAEYVAYSKIETEALAN